MPPLDRARLGSYYLMVYGGRTSFTMKSLDAHLISPDAISPL